MNDVEKHFTSEVGINKDSHGLKHALSAIAQEIQRFHTPQAIEIFTTPREVKSDEKFDKLKAVQSELSTKKRQVKKLQKKIKTAYFVAKSVMSAKEEETACLSKHIQLTRDQCQCLLQKSRHSSKVIEDLKGEGQILKDKMEAIELFINLGYEELQKMRNKPLEKTSVMLKLKEIMVGCGQYYSDYYNEHEKTLQLEQKNRYLTHKINLLTHNLVAISEDLDNMRTQKMRLQAENETLKGKQNRAKSIMDVHEVESRQSFYTIDNKIYSKSSSDDQKCKKKPANLNFSSHLSLIQRLLIDQDDMLKSLKKISEELTIHEYL